jgi:hypothetical protein
MSAARQTAVELMALFVPLVVTFIAIGWLLMEIAELSVAAVTMLLAPAATITIAAAAYGYYIGWERRHGYSQQVEARAVIREALRLVLWSLLVLVATLSALYCLWTRLYGPSALLGLAAGWMLIRLLREVGLVLSRGNTAHATAAPIYRPVSRSFERRFRILVFGFVTVIPVAFVLLFLWLREPAIAAVFSAIGLTVSPWALRKVYAEWRS